MPFTCQIEEGYPEGTVLNFVKPLYGLVEAKNH